MSIVIKNLSKQYNMGKTKALDNICTKIPEGTFGLLGENGAGKSSLLKILATVSVVDKGKVYYDNFDIAKDTSSIRSMIGYLPQKFDFFEKLTVYEMLEYIALLKGISGVKTQILDLLNEFNLKEKENVMISKLSGGMKQRVAIAGVMAMRPKCIVLDEPTAMLDPNGRKDVLKAVRELNEKEGVTVILITHYMEEVIEADQVFVMDKGHVVMHGTPKEVFSQEEKLKKYRLDVPQVTMLADELRKRGLDIPKGILKKEELVEVLCRLN